MTIAAAHPRIVQYPDAGQAGPFVVDFRFLDAADLIVELRAADGSLAVLTGWSAAGAGEPDGGTVTLAQPAPTGSILTIRSRVARIQPADYIAADAFPAETHEAALDRLTLIAQDQDRDLARTLAAPHGETLTPLPTAAARAGGILAFDETGQPDTSRDYNTLVADIAQTVAPAAVTMIAEAGAEAAAAVASRGDEEQALLEAQRGSIATSLGLLAGGFIDTIPLAEGFDGGIVITDENGWTTDDRWLDRDTGTPGTVVRFKRPNVDLSGEGGAYQVAVLPKLATGALAYHLASDALDGGAVMVNRLAETDPDDNIIFYATGVMPNAGAGAVSIPAALTNADDDWVEIQLTTTDQFYVWVSDLPPAGQYSVRIEVKSYPGSGNQDIRYGNSAAYSTATATEAGASLTYEFTATGSGSSYNNFQIRGNGSNTPRLLIRRAVCQQVASAASLPAWGDLASAAFHARKAIAWPNGLPKIGRAIDNSGNLARMLMRTASWPLATDFDEMTIIVGVEPPATAASSRYAFSADVDAREGTTVATFGIGITSTGNVSHAVGATGTGGPIGIGAAGLLRAFHAGRTGVLFLALRLSASERRAAFGGVDFTWDTTAWSGIAARAFRYMGASSSFNYSGKFFCGAIWDRFLSDGEMLASIEKMAYDMPDDDEMDFIQSAWLCDSRGAGGGGVAAADCFYQRITANGYFGVEPNEFGYLFGSGGETFDSMLSNDLPALKRMAMQATARGRKFAVYMLLGVNDGPAFVANSTTYWLRQRNEFWRVLGAHENAERIVRVAFTETSNLLAGWDAANTSFSNSVRAAQGTEVEFVVDLQATALGEAGAYSNPTLSSDGTHWLAAAQESPLTTTIASIVLEVRAS